MTRERLWSIVARRATAAVYRRSPRADGARRRAGLLVDAQGTLPQPRLEEQLAINLADRMPGWLVRLCGVRGLRLAAWLLARPLRLVSRMIGLGPLPREGRA